MCTIKFISRLTPFYSTVVKLYLRLELTEQPTLYDAIEHAEPARTDESALPLQEAAP